MRKQTNIFKRLKNGKVEELETKIKDNNEQI